MPEPAASPKPASPWFLTLLWCIVIAIAVLTAVAMVPGSLDVFRTPKDLALLSLSLVLLAVAAGGALLSEDIARSYRVSSPPVFVALGAAAWTAVVSMTSLRPYASLGKPLTVFCCATFFLAVLVLAQRRRGVLVVMIPLVPALVNAVIATLQSTHLWQPWTIDPRIPERVRTTGLIGNPNDLGTYLVIPLMAALAAAIAWPRHKWLYAVAVLLVGGLVSAQSVTPFGAAIAGLFVMAAASGTRRLRAGVVAAALGLVVLAVAHPGSRARLLQLRESVEAGQLPEMTSFRIVPTMTALGMFRDRPLVGVGPGTFSAVYMSYKLRTDAAHPQWMRLGNESFGQVHNDHAQLLAETGLPGYLLFVTGLGLLAAITIRGRGRPAADGEVRFARIFALPGAAAFAVLALAQFPLQLTAPIVPALFFSALCFAWTASDETA